jgi:hypothetical protein
MFVGFIHDLILVHSQLYVMEVDPKYMKTIEKYVIIVNNSR